MDPELLTLWDEQRPVCKPLPVQAPSAESPPRFCWSDDEERFRDDYATRDEALAAARSYADPRQTVWTARIVPAGFFLMCEDRVAEIIDDMREAAHGEYGEVAEDWLTRTTEEQDQDLRRMLGDAFEAWVKKHGHQPDWHGVEDIERHEPEAGHAG